EPGHRGRGGHHGEADQGHHGKADHLQHVGREGTVRASEVSVGHGVQAQAQHHPCQGGGHRGHGGIAQQGAGHGGGHQGGEQHSGAASDQHDAHGRQQVAPLQRVGLGHGHHARQAHGQAE